MRAKTAENQARGGGIGSRFPGVKNLRIQLTFLDARQNVLEEKRLALSPSDAASFTAPCPGRCGHGTFDFSGKVADTIAARLPSSDAGAKCPEPLYAGAAETCGCEVKCRLEIDYLPEAGSASPEMAFRKAAP